MCSKVKVRLSCSTFGLTGFVVLASSSGFVEENDLPPPFADSQSRLMRPRRRTLESYLIIIYIILNHDIICKT
jgi:hypothetical protein